MSSPRTPTTTLASPPSLPALSELAQPLSSKVLYSLLVSHNTHTNDEAKEGDGDADAQREPLTRVYGAVTSSGAVLRPCSDAHVVRAMMTTTATTMPAVAMAEQEGCVFSRCAATTSSKNNSDDDCVTCPRSVLHTWRRQQRRGERWDEVWLRRGAQHRTHNISAATSVTMTHTRALYLAISLPASVLCNNGGCSSDSSSNSNAACWQDSCRYNMGRSSGAAEHGGGSGGGSDAATARLFAWHCPANTLGNAHAALAQLRTLLTQQYAHVAARRLHMLSTAAPPLPQCAQDVYEGVAEARAVAGTAKVIFHYYACGSVQRDAVLRRGGRDVVLYTHHTPPSLSPAGRNNSNESGPDSDGGGSHVDGREEASDSSSGSSYISNSNSSDNSDTHGLCAARHAHLCGTPLAPHIAVSLSTLLSRAQLPLVFIADCPAAGDVLHELLRAHDKRLRSAAVAAVRQQQQQQQQQTSSSSASSSLPPSQQQQQQQRRPLASSSSRPISAVELDVLGEAVTTTASSTVTRAAVAQSRPRLLPARGEFFFIGASGASATTSCASADATLLSRHAQLPDDILTSCLTTPVQTAMLWYMARHSGLSARHTRTRARASDALHPSLLYLFVQQGAAADKKTPLGQLHWYMQTVIECVAWTSLSADDYALLFREDVYVAPLFRGYVLAEYLVVAGLGGAVSVYPPLPPMHTHALWHTLNAAIEATFVALLRVVSPTPARPLHSVREFRAWLDMPATRWRYEHEAREQQRHLLLKQQQQQQQHVVAASAHMQRRAVDDTYNDDDNDDDNDEDEEDDTDSVSDGDSADEARTRTTPTAAAAADGAVVVSVRDALAAATAAMAAAQPLPVVRHDAVLQLPDLFLSELHSLDTVLRAFTMPMCTSTSRDDERTHTSSKHTRHHDPVPAPSTSVLLSRMVHFPLIERLPMLLQTLLTAAHRHKATQLLCRLVDTGPAEVLQCAEMNVYRLVLDHYWVRADLRTRLLPAALFVFAKSCYVDVTLAAGTAGGGAGAAASPYATVVRVCAEVLRCPVTLSPHSSAASTRAASTLTTTTSSSSLPLYASTARDTAEDMSSGAWQHTTLGLYACGRGQRLLSAALLCMLAVHTSDACVRCQDEGVLQQCCQLLYDEQRQQQQPHRVRYTLVLVTLLHVLLHSTWRLPQSDAAVTVTSSSSSNNTAADASEYDEYEQLVQQSCTRSGRLALAAAAAQRQARQQQQQQQSQQQSCATDARVLRRSLCIALAPLEALLYDADASVLRGAALRAMTAVLFSSSVPTSLQCAYVAALLSCICSGSNSSISNNNMAATSNVTAASTLFAQRREGNAHVLLEHVRTLRVVLRWLMQQQRKHVMQRSRSSPSLSYNAHTSMARHVRMCVAQWLRTQHEQRQQRRQQTPHRAAGMASDDDDNDHNEKGGNVVAGVTSKHACSLGALPGDGSTTATAATTTASSTSATMSAAAAATTTTTQQQLASIALQLCAFAYSDVCVRVATMARRVIVNELSFLHMPTLPAAAAASAHRCALHNNNNNNNGNSSTGTSATHTSPHRAHITHVPPAARRPHRDSHAHAHHTLLLLPSPSLLPTTHKHTTSAAATTRATLLASSSTLRRHALLAHRNNNNSSDDDDEDDGDGGNGVWRALYAYVRERMGGSCAAALCATPHHRRCRDDDKDDGGSVTPPRQHARSECSGLTRHGGAARVGAVCDGRGGRGGTTIDGGSDNDNNSSSNSSSDDDDSDDMYASPHHTSAHVHAHAHAAAAAAAATRSAQYRFVYSALSFLAHPLLDGAQHCHTHCRRNDDGDDDDEEVSDTNVCDGLCDDRRRRRYAAQLRDGLSASCALDALPLCALPGHNGSSGNSSSSNSGSSHDDDEQRNQAAVADTSDARDDTHRVTSALVVSCTHDDGCGSSRRCALAPAQLHEQRQHRIPFALLAAHNNNNNNDKYDDAVRCVLLHPTLPHAVTCTTRGDVRVWTYNTRSSSNSSSDVVARSAAVLQCVAHYRASCVRDTPTTHHDNNTNDNDDDDDRIGSGSGDDEHRSLHTSKRGGCGGNKNKTLQQQQEESRRCVCVRALHLIDPAQRPLLCAVHHCGVVELLADYTRASCVHRVAAFATTPLDCNYTGSSNSSSSSARRAWPLAHYSRAHACLSSYQPSSSLLYVARNSGSSADAVVAAWDMCTEQEAYVCHVRGEDDVLPHNNNNNTVTMAAAATTAATHTTASVLTTHPTVPYYFALATGTVRLYDVRSTRAMHMLSPPPSLASDTECGSNNVCALYVHCVHVGYSLRYPHMLTTGYTTGVLLAWDDRMLRTPLHAFCTAPLSRRTSSSGGGVVSNIRATSMTHMTSLQQQQQQQEQDKDGHDACRMSVSASSRRLLTLTTTGAAVYVSEPLQMHELPTGTRNDDKDNNNNDRDSLSRRHCYGDRQAAAAVLSPSLFAGTRCVLREVVTAACVHTTRPLTVLATARGSVALFGRPV